jgi:hypothetical protein
MTKCALCPHYESEHTPAHVDPARRCRVRYFGEFNYTLMAYGPCECPGWEPQETGPFGWTDQEGA